MMDEVNLAEQESAAQKAQKKIDRQFADYGRSFGRSRAHAALSVLPAPRDTAGLAALEQSVLSANPMRADAIRLDVQQATYDTHWNSNGGDRARQWWNAFHDYNHGNITQADTHNFNTQNLIPIGQTRDLATAPIMDMLDQNVSPQADIDRGEMLKKAMTIELFALLKAVDEGTLQGEAAKDKIVALMDVINFPVQSGLKQSPKFDCPIQYNVGTRDFILATMFDVLLYAERDGKGDLYRKKTTQPVVHDLLQLTAYAASKAYKEGDTSLKDEAEQHVSQTGIARLRKGYEKAAERPAFLGVTSIRHLVERLEIGKVRGRLSSLMQKPS